MTEEDYKAEKSILICKRVGIRNHLTDASTTYNFLSSHKQMPEDVFVDVQINYKAHLSDTRLGMDDTTWAVLRKTMMRTLSRNINAYRKTLLEYDSKIAKLDCEWMESQTEKCK